MNKQQYSQKRHYLMNLTKHKTVYYRNQLKAHGIHVCALCGRPLAVYSPRYGGFVTLRKHYYFQANHIYIALCYNPTNCFEYIERKWVALGALVDSLKDAIGGNHSKQDQDEAVDNVKRTLQLASKRLLESVQNNDQELDVKDIKDLAGVYTLLTQTDGSGNGEAQTPQASAGIADVFDDHDVKVNKTPDGDEEIDPESLDDLSEDDVKKLVTDSFKKQNEDNYNKVKEA